MFIAPATAFFISLALFGAGALGSLIFVRQDSAANWWGNGLALAASFFALLSAAGVLLSGAGFSWSAPTTLPFLALSINMDALAAFFTLVIALVSVAASLYAFGYVKHFYGKYSVGRLGFFYNAFIAGMLLVVAAGNALFFLIVWEVMSLASYFLVVFEHKNAESREAGTRYFVMTHVGTAAILFAFLLLYGHIGSFDFAAIKAGAAALPSSVKNAVLFLALIGFGTKAGIIPLHIWLPSAHPAAPTHVSALMSGVMIKTGIYMLIRVFIDLVPGASLGWGITVLLIGAVSSVLGVLYALTEHDLKRLLAYHSIENIGIILLGLGASLIFLSAGMPTLALLALVAALFHTLNHATFKGLLFLGAGSVISKTHTRNIEEYGGLIKLMPYTALFFLVGSLAISALPPFNGFFSEWATFQSLFAGIAAVGPAAQWAFVAAAASLALTGGLAAACFVKAFGVSFLARPRSTEAEHASETSFAFQGGMALLALAIVGIGIFAGPVANVLQGVARTLSPLASAAPAFSASARTFALTSGFATVSMPLIFIALILAILGTMVAVRLFTPKTRCVVAGTWDCGSLLSPRMEITATGFSRSLIRIFSGVLKPTEQSGIEYADASLRYLPKAHVVELGIADVYEQYLYAPLKRAALFAASRVKRIQSGNVNAYILYQFVIIAALLFFVAI
ncbi:MAG: hydrogenase 4 subunit B [Patescibacteria group bacterium]|nr:hydrogenase 4 subunit B [Patescibacteria group bacterium]